MSSAVVGHAETELLLTQPLRWCIPSDSIFGCRATELLLNNYQTQTKQSPPPSRKSRLAGSCSARAAALVARLAVARVLVQLEATRCGLSLTHFTCTRVSHLALLKPSQQLRVRQETACSELSTNTERWKIRRCCLSLSC